MEAGDRRARDDVLFGPQPVHLNDIYNRPSNSTRQFWTLPYVPGRRLAGKDVYVLTSSFTFSGGEEFAYNLKQLKRATLVGEVTGGGANPGGGRRLADHFGITPDGPRHQPDNEDQLGRRRRRA